MKEVVLQALLIAVNFVFTLLSISLILLGWIYGRDLPLIECYIVRQEFLFLPQLFIILGALSFAASICSFYFVKHYNANLLRVLILFLVVLLVFEMRLACLTFLNIGDTDLGKIETTMELQLNKTKAKKEFYKIEERYTCCGIYGVEDYESDEMVLIEGSLCYKIFQFISRMPVTGCSQTLKENIIRMATEIGCYMIVFAALRIIDLVCLIMILFQER